MNRTSYDLRVLGWLGAIALMGCGADPPLAEHVRWSAHLEGTPVALVVMGEDPVIVWQGGLGYGGGATAFSAATGDQLWTSPFSNPFGIGTVGTGANGELLELYPLDPMTVQITTMSAGGIRRTEPWGPFGGAGGLDVPRFVIANGLVATQTCRADCVFDVRRSTDRGILWSASRPITPDGPQSIVALGHDGDALVADAAQLVRYTAAGELAWSIGLTRAVYAPDGDILLLDGTHVKRVRRDQSLRWEVELDGEGLTSAVVGEQEVYVSFDGGAPVTPGHAATSERAPGIAYELDGETGAVLRTHAVFASVSVMASGRDLFLGLEGTELEAGGGGGDSQNTASYRATGDLVAVQRAVEP